MEDGKWIRKEASRSYPKPTHPHTPIVGVKVHNEGPLHLHDVTFKNFKQNGVASKMCGISFVDAFRFGMGSSSSVKGQREHIQLNQ